MDNPTFALVSLLALLGRVCLAPTLCMHVQEGVDLLVGLDDTRSPRPSPLVLGVEAERRGGGLICLGVILLLVPSAPHHAAKEGDRGAAGHGGQVVVLVLRVERPRRCHNQLVRARCAGHGQRRDGDARSGALAHLVAEGARTRIAGIVIR